MSRWFASSLASRVRLAKNNFKPVGSLSWSRNYGGQAILDCNVIEESFLPCGKNPTCDPDEYGIKYLPIMRQAICVEGRKLREAGVDAMDLKNGIFIALEAIGKRLKCSARIVSTSKEIAQVGTTAASGDKNIGELIAKIMEEIGKEGVFIISDKKNSNDELKFMNGMKLNWGSISPYFIDEVDRARVLKKPLVFIHANKISNKNVLKDAFTLTDFKRPLLIVAEGLDMKVGGSLLRDFTCLQTPFGVIKPPLEFEFEENLKTIYEKNWKGIMEDLAILTGTRVVTEAYAGRLFTITLGSCKEVKISENETIIFGGSGTEASIKKRCEQLRYAIKLSALDYEIKLLEERLLRLSGGVAIFKVGGASKSEVRKKNKRITNALTAAKAAMEEGIIPGGGVALLHASKELDQLQTTSSSGKFGVRLLQHALKMPVYANASAAGFEGSAVVKKLLEQDNLDLGFDPTSGEYVDMIKSGIVDPVKFVIKELNDMKSYFDSWCSSGSKKD